MKGCPGCRYCEWLPQVTRQMHGCPGRDVARAVVKTVQSRKRQRVSEGCTEQPERFPADRRTRCRASTCRSSRPRIDKSVSVGTGRELFCAEYSQSVRAVDASLLCKAGGAQGVLECMWTMLSPQRQLKYAAFAVQHRSRNEALGSAVCDLVSPSARTPRCLEYFSASQNWDMMSPYFKSEDARELWLPAMCQLWLDRRSTSRGAHPTSSKSVVVELLRLPGAPDSEADLLPSHFEASDWRHNSRQQPRLSRDGDQQIARRECTHPTFWGWVCDGACHSLVPLYLWIAQQVEPMTAWRVITSDAHSTVWDGAGRLFDPQFEAMGIEPTETFRRAGGSIFSTESVL